MRSGVLLTALAATLITALPDPAIVATQLSVLEGTVVAGQLVQATFASVESGVLKIKIELTATTLTQTQIDDFAVIIAGLIGQQPESLYNVVVSAGQGLLTVSIDCCHNHGGVSIALQGQMQQGVNINSTSMDWFPEGITPPIPAHQLVQMPQEVAGGMLFKLGDSRKLDTGSTVVVHNKGSTVCDVFVFIWHEPPMSSPYNGDLPMTLGDDWRPGRCAPKFTEGNCTYKMTAFRRQFLPSEIIFFSVALHKAAQYVVVAAVESVDCTLNTLDSQAACEGAHPNCRWTGDVCMDDWCPTLIHDRPRGPVGGDVAAAESGRRSCGLPYLEP